MKITLNFEANSLPKKNGTYPIYLRATENGYHYKKALDAYVTDRRHFDPKAKRQNWISTKEPLAKVFNARLALELETAHKIMLGLEQRNELSAQNFMKALKGNNKESFLEFVERQIQQHKDRKQFGTALATEHFRDKLVGYAKGQDVLFRDLTYSFVDGFVDYLSKTPNRTGRTLSESTIDTIVRRFKTMYKKALLEDLIVFQSNPFDKIKVKRPDTHRLGLTKEEVERLKNLDLPEKSLLWHTRNYFLFSMYMAGIRIGDLIALTWGNVIDGRLIYNMQKTKSPRSIQIIHQAQEILDLYWEPQKTPSDYIFPVFLKHNRRKYSEYEWYQLQKSKVVLSNIRLKKLASLAGIVKPLSNHIARHTFANLASTSEGGDVYHISKLLGHTDIATTQIYLNSLNYKHQDELHQRIFD